MADRRAADGKQKAEGDRQQAENRRMESDRWKSADIEWQAKICAYYFRNEKRRYAR